MKDKITESICDLFDVRIEMNHCIKLCSMTDMYRENALLKTKDISIPGLSGVETRMEDFYLTITDKLVMNYSELEYKIFRDMICFLKLGEMLDEMENFIYENIELDATEEEIRFKLDYWGYPYWVYYNFWARPKGSQYTFTKENLYSLYEEKDVWIKHTLGRPEAERRLSEAIDDVDLAVYPIIKYLYNVPNIVSMTHYGSVYKLLKVAITQDFTDELYCDLEGMQNIRDIYFHKFTEREK